MVFSLSGFAAAVWHTSSRRAEPRSGRSSVAHPVPLPVLEARPRWRRSSPAAGSRWTHPEHRPRSGYWALERLGLTSRSLLLEFCLQLPDPRSLGRLTLWRRGGSLLQGLDLGLEGCRLGVVGSRSLTLSRFLQKASTSSTVLGPADSTASPVEPAGPSPVESVWRSSVTCTSYCDRVTAVTSRVSYGWLSGTPRACSARMSST